MKAYGGVDVYIHIFLTSAVAGGEWSASCPGRFNPGERSHAAHWIGGWVDPRAGLDNMKKRKLLIVPGLEIRPLGRPALPLLLITASVQLESKVTGRESQGACRLYEPTGGKLSVVR
jgi:hypothetical protein